MRRKGREKGEGGGGARTFGMRLSQEGEIEYDRGHLGERKKLILLFHDLFSANESVFWVIG